MIKLAFSKEDIYNESIKKLVGQILIECDHNKIPVFMTFAVKDGRNGTVYKTEMLSAAAEEVTLKDDRIAKHALVMNGFDVVPRTSISGIEEFMEVVTDG